MNNAVTSQKTKRIAILQSNYIPWKGYFDIIRSVDEFIIYDEMQYTRKDWRNRNQIKTRIGLQWLTIPVRHDNSKQKINETTIADQKWAQTHWKTLSRNYARAEYFQDYKAQFEDLYLGCHLQLLSDINIHFLKGINTILGITTPIHRSRDYQLADGPTERLVDLCKQFQATEYLTGPSASNYIDESLFAQENIAIIWANYSDYPQYRQLHYSFEHGVTALDLIFNEGSNANQYTRQF